MLEFPSKEYEKFNDTFMNKVSFFFGSSKNENLTNNYFILNKKVIFQNLQIKYEELLKQIVKLSLKL